MGALRAHKALGLGALLLALAVASSAQSYSAAVDTGAVVDEVNALSSAGRWNEAASLLDQALSIYPADSDLLYLRALAKAKTGVSIYDALADAAAAASGSGFSRYSERDAAVLQADFLVRLRRYDEALRILSSKALLSSSDAAARLIRAKALALNGSRAAFVDEIRAAIERFPNDPAFPRLFLSRVTKIPYLPSERTLGELIVSRARRYAEFDPEIPVLTAPIMGDRIERENAVRAFRAAGGMSAAATLRALEYGIIDETKAINEITGGSYPLNRRDLEELVSLLRTPAAVKAMIAAITSWTGWVEVDREKDAVIEERFRLTRGLVSSWELDVDQDGLFDDIAVFSDGLPASIEIKTADVSIKIVYGSYPEIATAEFNEGKQSRLYSFGPGIVVVSPFKMQRFIGEGREAVFIPEQSGEAMPSERYWASLALNVRTTKADGEYEDSVLNRGIVESSRGYRNGRLYSISQYQRGMIVSSKIDEDGDGRFERELSYDASSPTGPLLTWIRIDTDGDGVFDYREQAVSPFRKEWDFDADGMIDAAQYKLPDGSVRAEFSSRLDGRMDESLTVKNGKIVEFRRDGKSIALIADFNPSVTWIGKKPFDIGNNVPDVEGLYKKAGIRYRITKVGNLVFAEIVP